MIPKYIKLLFCIPFVIPCICVPFTAQYLPSFQFTGMEI